jgi:GT2 family glycosyltransferase
VPFFNQLDPAKGPMGLLKHVTSPATEWLIIDNGSTDPVEAFFRDTLRPKRLQFLRNDENVGMIQTYQQIFDAVETDLVAILHNDVFVYESGWDKRVTRLFKTIPNLGSAGFFGTQGVGPIGERIQDTQHPGQMSGLSNLLEAERHGIRLEADYRPAAILDGFAMIFSMKMVREAGGIDQHYRYHHLYDRDLPLTALSLGYKNIVVNVSCHHWSGLTANQSEYQVWINQKLNREKADDHTHRVNSKLFAKKWADVLPLYVENDFSFRKGRHGKWDFKGNSIVQKHK